MRQSYRVVVFALVAFAGSAAADCAWVLWSRVGGTAYIVGAYPTRSDCYTEMTIQKQEKPPSRGEVLSCLPDTVDPRGPKGGGR
jgi:hypothetical protein